MNIVKVGAIALAIVAFSSGAAGAQELFHLSFHGNSKFLNDRGRVSNKRITARDLIARCVGTTDTNVSGTNIQFDLVYNASDQLVQVVDLTNGTVVCDVFQFQAGTTNSDGRRVERLAFVFIPEQTEAVGSATITERIRRNDTLRSMHGEVQLMLPSMAPGSASGSHFTDTTTSSTNATSASNTLTGTAANANTSGTTLTNTLGVISFPDNGSVTTITNSNSALTGTVSTPSASTGTSAITLPPMPATPVLGNTSTNASPSASTNSAPGLPGLPSISTPGSSLTNIVATPDISAGSTGNSLSVSNAVVVSGSFSTGKRVLLNTP